MRTLEQVTTDMHDTLLHLDRLEGDLLEIRYFLQKTGNFEDTTSYVGLSLFIEKLEQKCQEIQDDLEEIHSSITQFVFELNQLGYKKEYNGKI